MSTHKLLQIDESAIASLLASPAVLEAIPALKAYAKQVNKKGCGCGTGNRRKAVVYTSVKQILADLPKSSKDKLKEILKAQTIRIRYKDAKGTETEKTF